MWKVEWLVKIFICKNIWKIWNKANNDFTIRTTLDKNWVQVLTLLLFQQIPPILKGIQERFEDFRFSSLPRQAGRELQNNLDAFAEAKIEE